MEVKVVTGSNYGDESKGLVSGCLARQAIENEHKKVLTVFYNGTAQRQHDFMGQARHTLGAGEAFGADTFYHRAFVVDPIMLWVFQTPVIIDPRCRVILPCDVLYGQAREKVTKHGSCGFGLFAAVKRNETEPLQIQHLFCGNYGLPDYKRIQGADKFYGYTPNNLHNLTNFLRALDWMKKNCRFITFEQLMRCNEYDTIIYEGGQGLLLDQANRGDFPHLTPSSTGAYNIHKDIEALGAPLDLYYVSRSYMTRHGAGPMDDECKKEDINPDIVDLTNQPNEWQGALRFGRIDLDKLYKRVEGDAARYACDKKVNMVFTHLNYTDSKIETIDGRAEIVKPSFVIQMWGSDRKDFMSRIE